MPRRTPFSQFLILLVAGSVGLTAVVPSWTCQAAGGGCGSQKQNKASTKSCCCSSQGGAPCKMACPTSGRNQDEPQPATPAHTNQPKPQPLALATGADFTVSPAETGDTTGSSLLLCGLFPAFSLVSEHVRMQV
jgi:hypothetical protein